MAFQGDVLPFGGARVLGGNDGLLPVGDLHVARSEVSERRDGRVVICLLFPPFCVLPRTSYVLLDGFN